MLDFGHLRETHGGEFLIVHGGAIVDRQSDRRSALRAVRRLARERGLQLRDVVCLFLGPTPGPNEDDH